MNKELLISIKPEHLVNILNGKKTLELRKRAPKNYKGWVYIYCTKGGKGLFKDNKDNDYFLFNNGNSSLSLNGKVVARFWYDEYENVDYQKTTQTMSENKNVIIKLRTSHKYILDETTLKKLSLNYEDVQEYGKGNELYMWIIKDLTILHEPKELNEFYRTNLWITGEYIFTHIKGDDLKNYQLKRPPQSYQFVYVKELEK